MALIKCPICGNDVSNHSKACPKCGEPVHEVMPTEEQRIKIKKDLKRDMIICLMGAVLFSGITIYLAYIGEPRAYRYFVPAILALVNLIKFNLALKKYEKE